MATTLKEGAELVNQSLKELGYDYQIDTTNDQTISDGLEAIGAYAPSQRNQIMEQMNIILQQRNYGVMFNERRNEFRVFLTNLMEFGFGIEDVFHELLDGVTPLWDNNGTAEEIANDLVSYDTNKIHKFFHTTPMQRQFKTTLDRRNYEKVFTSYGVTRYVDTKLANLGWSAEVWLQQKIVDTVKRMISDGKIVFSTGYNLNSTEGVANATEGIKATIGGFLTPSTLYNYGVYNEENNTYRPVINMTDSKDDIFVITTPEYMERIKVQGYANAFNLSQFELDGRIIYAPAGTDLGEKDGEKVLFVVLDRRAIVAGIKTWDGTSFFVPNIKTTNHWLTVEGIMGYNTVFNAVAFTGESVDSFFGEDWGSRFTLVTTSSNIVKLTESMYINGSAANVNDFYYVSDDNSGLTFYTYKHCVREFELTEGDVMWVVNTISINGTSMIPDGMDPVHTCAVNVPRNGNLYIEIE